MKITILNRPGRASRPASPGLRASATALTAALLLLATADLRAGVPNGVVVGTVCGGGYPPYYGYVEGNPIPTPPIDAQFHTPIGLAMDSAGGYLTGYLLVADRDNNAIRAVDLTTPSTPHCNFTYTVAPIPGLTPSGTISNPVGVALDADDNVYVLNRGNGNNGTVVEFDCYGYSPNGYSYFPVTNNTVALTNANAITLDPAGNIYLTASNNLIRITPAGVQTTVATVTNTGACLQGLVVMESGSLAVCDSGRNGIYLINPASGVISTNTGFNGAGDNESIWTNTFDNPVPKTLAMFNQPMGLALAGNNTLIVSDYGNNRVKVVNSAGTVTNLYGVSSDLWYNGGWHDGNVVVPDALGDVEARLPNGVLFAGNDTVYVTEDYYHLIRQVTANFSPLPPPPPPGLTALANCGQIGLTWSPSAGATSYDVQRSTTNGGPYASITYTSSTNYIDTSVQYATTYYYVIAAVGPGGEGANSAPVSATLPPLAAPTIFPPGTNLIANGWQVTLTWSPICGSNITYDVQRTSPNGQIYITNNISSTRFTDINVPGGTNYYVVSAVPAGGNEGPGSVPLPVILPLLPPPVPEIGWVMFTNAPLTGLPLSVLITTPPFIFYNDESIGITCAAGTELFFTYCTTPGCTPPDPTTNDYQAPVFEDGVSSNAVPPSLNTVVCFPNLGNLTIKAIGAAPGTGEPNSTVAQETFQFITAKPNIYGNNAALFAISDITTNADLYYTLDGSDPTTNSSHFGTVGPLDIVCTNGFFISTDTLFKVRAFHNLPCDIYQPSAIASNVFYATNFVPNTISFGFASGEASSQFIGSPGQTFYAPVTLSVLPNTLMYSLQFNVTVTTNITATNNPNPGPAVTPGAFGFQSMLVKPVVPTPTNYPPGFSLYSVIPPYMFIDDASSPPPPSQIVPYYNGINNGFINLEFINTNLNLLGVGWLERYAETNLYDTLSQDLIEYSEAHDDVFLQSAGTVIAGGYGFQIPGGAKPGQQYQIQIGLPSATSDGVGAPGSAVYIATPTNGSLAAGPINAIKLVTVGQFKYLVGDAYPFRWFNAGDFGDTNLNNADVEQVFEAAVYNLNTPPTNTDFFDSMDSCGGTYMDLGHGYLEFNSYISGPNALNPLFNGTDASINQIAFGDGVLDVCDVYVTFRRSLDTNWYRFQRFWTNGVRGAQILTSPLASGQSQASPEGGVAPQVASVTNAPSVSFAATDFIASAGQTVQVPITATIFGNFPLRVLMLGLSVEPLDGSPALTSPVQFAPNAALGAPAMTSSTGNGNYAATWLDSTIAGLTGTVTLGTLTVTVPANAPSSAAYAVHFDHASASPNGLASFPKQTLTGLITLSSRSNSYYKDGIPDSWRLRWFGTIYNVLSEASADACGDGINNLAKYIAGTDPTDPKAYPRLNSLTPPPAGSTFAIHWPTVSGKQYVIERSASLFPGGWTAIATNTGTGTDMEFNDNNSGKTAFYRVWILP